MKKITTKEFLQLTKATFNRFPEVILLSILASCVSIYVSITMNHTKPDFDTQQYNLVETHLLGISMLISSKLFAEQLKFSKYIKAIVRCLPILILIAFHYGLSEKFSYDTVFKFTTLAVAFHLLVFSAAFIIVKDDMKFWLFCKQLIKQGVFSLFITTVIFLAIFILSLILSKVTNHNLDIGFISSFILSYGVLFTWVFLSGLPTDLEHLENEADSLDSLEKIANYILFPLLYLGAAFAGVNSIRFVFSSLNFAWVAFPILIFAGLTVLTFIIVYPLLESIKSKWFIFITRWVYLISIPLLCFLLFVIAKHTALFGITVYRYFVIILTFWFLFISIFILLSKKKNISLIPLSLVILCLAVTFGFWRPYAVSEKCQLARLERIFKSEGIERIGESRNPKPMAFEKRKEIYSILSYICKIHGYKCLENLFYTNIDLYLNRLIVENHAQALMDIARLKPIASEHMSLKEQSDVLSSFFIKIPNNGTYSDSLAKFKYLLNINEFDPSNTNCKKCLIARYTLNGKPLTIEYNKDSLSLDLNIESEHASIDLKHLFLNYMSEHDQSDPSKKDFFFIFETKAYKLKFVLLKMEAQTRKEIDEVKLTNLNGYLMLRPKNGTFASNFHFVNSSNETSVSTNKSVEDQDNIFLFMPNAGCFATGLGQFQYMLNINHFEPTYGSGECPVVEYNLNGYFFTVVYDKGNRILNVSYRGEHATLNLNQLLQKNRRSKTDANDMVLGAKTPTFNMKLVLLNLKAMNHGQGEQQMISDINGYILVSVNSDVKKFYNGVTF